jgi:MtN3 and saliva related transmembrane protein
MEITDFIGYIAASLTTCSFMPQAIQVIKTKHTKDISLAMYVMLVTGICLWLAYGIMLKQWPIILSNIITIIPTTIILIMKMRERI